MPHRRMGWCFTTSSTVLLFLEISPMPHRAEMHEESIPCWLKCGGAERKGRTSIPCWLNFSADQTSPKGIRLTLAVEQRNPSGSSRTVDARCRLFAPVSAFQPETGYFTSEARQTAHRRFLPRKFRQDMPRKKGHDAMKKIDE